MTCHGYFLRGANDMPHILTRKDFDPATHNEHFLIFLTSEGYEEGDALESHAYTIWVSEQVTRFKAKHRLTPSQSIGLVPDWKNRFTRFIRSRLDDKRTMGHAE